MNKYIKISITIITIILMIIIYIYINKSQKITGTITIEIIYELSNDEKNFQIEEETTLEKLLNENYDIIINNGMLIKINNLQTNNLNDEFIKIFINDKPANKGISGIKLNDGDKITFKIEKTFQYE